jgi:C4-dicarboxylate-specific signal transduction histidine kinase
MLTHIDHAGDILWRMRNFIRRGNPHVSMINTRDMLEEAMTLAQAEASARHVRVDLDAPANLPDLHGDRVQLEQIVLNLSASFSADDPKTTYSVSPLTDGLT